MVELSSKKHSSSRKLCRLLLFASVITAWGCAGGVAPPTVVDPPPAAEPTSFADAQEQELRALLLLMSDQKFLDPVTVAAAASGGPDLRRQLALTLSRVGDPRGGPALQSLLADDDVEVRRAAVFGLGELAERGDRTARQALLAAIADPDPRSGRLAVEGAAKAGAPIEDVIQRLLEAPSGEILSRLVPNLFRFDSPGTVGWAKQGLDDPELRPMAVYALTRNPQPKGLEIVRLLIEDRDPWIRSLAARALGRIGEREDMGLLRPLLDDSEPGPVVQALKSARLLIASGKVAAPDTWRERLLSLLDDSRSGVRITAIEAAQDWLLDETLSARLERFGREGSVRERELALTALAKADDPTAMSLLPAAYSSDLPSLRVAATKAAALMGAGDIVAAALADPQPGVRAAAFETALEIAPDPAGPMASVLADPDYVVRSTGLDWATNHPQIAYRTLTSAYEVARADREPDARLGAIKALVARARAAAEEAPAITSVLEELAESGDYLSRREAAAGLQALGQEAPRVGKVASRRTIQSYRQIVARTSAEARYAIETDAGTMVLQLMCPEAPLTCLSFMQLADQGFYDGLLFHRIVPDFVVQGGDPRGDGAGGPGYTIRDELNTIPFDTGILGMAHAGSDTTGSQFFLTITPQPHLNGGYTAFGRVVEGGELLRQWIQGQKIRRITRVPDGR